MKILLQSLLLVVGINLIAARAVYWGDQRFNYDDDDLFGTGFDRYLDFISDDISSEEIHKEPVISKTSFKDPVFNDDDNLEAEQLKDIQSFLDSLLAEYGEDNNMDARANAAASKEIKKNEHDDNGADDDVDVEDGDDKNDNDDNDDNTKEVNEEDEIIDKSNEELPIELVVVDADAEPILSKSSEESNETLTINADDDLDDDDTEAVKAVTVANDPIEEDDDELSEKEIRELAALLVTLSTMDDLLKVAEEITDEQSSQEAEKLFENKLKEVDSFMGFFVSRLDAILEDGSEEVGKDKEITENNDYNDNDNDNDDKADSKDDNDTDDTDDTDTDDTDDTDDNNDNEENEENDDNDANDDDKNEEDASVSFEFHSVDTPTNTLDMDTHKYNLIERSTTTAQEIKPTSSPSYTVESYSSTDNSKAAIIREYIEEREKLDTLEENFLTNKLNIDRDFYHSIVDGDDENNLQKFDNDIAAIRENIFKIKQSIDAIQNTKSKLYFHQLIKSALKTAQIN